MQSAELALEAGKKKVDELKKKLVISKRSLDQFKIDVLKAEEELRRKASDARRR
jgi:multidrug resistance efflux pump